MPWPVRPERNCTSPSPTRAGRRCWPSPPGRSAWTSSGYPGPGRSGTRGVPVPPGAGRVGGPAAGVRPAAFARCWTRKEACLKATGAGISEASLRTLRLGTGPLPARSPGWALTDLRVPAGYAAACAVREAAPSGESRPTRPSASSVRQHR
ncbi:4'-phosphopantetheinyl transferase superfamily protein [Streptomyces libani]|uniref:4'-phosphopantetheinyl transferase superfamily protein n=1 Tax=Streptomyces TaxID=1883 RepID=UPI002180C3E8